MPFCHCIFDCIRLQLWDSLLCWQRKNDFCTADQLYTGLCPSLGPRNL